MASTVSTLVFPPNNFSVYSLIFPLLSIVLLLSPVKIVAWKWIHCSALSSVVAKYWGKLLGSYRDKCTLVHGGAAQQGEAVALSALWSFARPPGFLCCTFLYSESVRMKNMFHWEEEKWTLWHWNSMPFAAKSLCSEFRDWNKCLHNWQIKIWTLSYNIFWCKNTPFMVMLMFIF